MSQEALGSGWVGLERSTVLFRDPGNVGRRFVPLLLVDCELPDTLRRYKYVDYRKETKAAFEALLAACRSADEKGGEDLAVGHERPPEGVIPGLLDKILPTRRKGQQPATPPKRQVNKGRDVTAPARERVPAEALAVLERTLTGHRWVNSVAISPDGKWAASGASDKRIKIWDLKTGRCRATLKGHTDEVNCVAITPDGKRVISGSKDCSVRIWDPSSAQTLKQLDGPKGEVWSVVALPDNTRILSAGWDNALTLWEISTGKCLKTIRTGAIGGDNIFCTAIRGGGNDVLSGHRDGSVRLWDMKTGECLATLKGHSVIVQTVQFILDGQNFVSGSGDRTIKVWDLDARLCIGTLEGHEQQVLAVAVSPDGSVIASTGFTDHTVRLWDWKSGTCLQVVEAKESPRSVAFSPDGSRLVVGTTDGVVIAYRLTGRHTARPVETSPRYVNAKVVLIGESTVGKTTLAHRLIEDRYAKTESTHGMNVWRLDLPLELYDTIEREALLWDLAGQEDYRLIHQLFLEETALALLLINPQKDDPFAEAGDWLKALRSAVTAKDSQRDVAKLLIPTRLDVGGMKVSERKINRFLKDHGFAACLATSAKRGDNCSDKANEGQPSKLKQLIAQHIPWDKLTWTSTPRLLAEIKNAVIAMRDVADIRLLRFAELAQRLEYALPKEDFGEADVRTAVTLLANHGLVRPLKFGDLVLLRPDLLNGYAAAIIAPPVRTKTRSDASWRRRSTATTSTLPAWSG
jgi:GTPase SAR1 family protein